MRVLTFKSTPNHMEMCTVAAAAAAAAAAHAGVGGCCYCYARMYVEWLWASTMTMITDSRYICILHPSSVLSLLACYLIYADLNTSGVDLPECGLQNRKKALVENSSLEAWVEVSYVSLEVSALRV